MQKNCRDRTPLYHTAENGKLDIFHLLISNYANIDEEKSSELNGFTPYCREWKAKYFSPTHFKLCLYRCKSSGKTSLHHTAEKEKQQSSDLYTDLMIFFQ